MAVPAGKKKKPNQYISSGVKFDTSADGETECDREEPKRNFRLARLEPPR